MKKTLYSHILTASLLLILMGCAVKKREIDESSFNLTTMIPAGLHLSSGGQDTPTIMISPGTKLMILESSASTHVKIRTENGWVGYIDRTLIKAIKPDEIN